MNLTITDEHYLKNYERLEKISWFQRYRARLFFSSLVVVYSILQIAFCSRQSTFLLDSNFWYFMIFLALLAVGSALYKRYIVLKRIPFMREYESQVRKIAMVYHFDENRLRMDYGGSFKECPWSMFQKFHFFKGYLIMSSEYYPMGATWIRITPENKSDLVNLTEMVQSKYKLQVMK